ncbi:MAG: four helix bundle protein [Cellvibrionaceae bacterium]
MKFADLDVWKRSTQLTIQVYRHLSSCKDYGFRDQITRSCLAVPSNIAEGLERYSDKEKSRFLDIAKSSCGEFYTQTYIGIKIGLVNPEQGQAWMKEARELSAMIGGFIKHLSATPTTSD